MGSSMREEHLRYLVCPGCSGDLSIARLNNVIGDSIENAQLRCSGCGSTYDVIRHIPRFVPLQNYASSFGLEWTRHSRTQYDSYSGARVSEERFFKETGWPRQMPGEMILEVGSGSGRFTEQAASTGAMVVSLDLSYAVEANYSSNGHKDNVLIVQADIYSMPVRADFFDRLFCIGVLQHTPDVERSFLSLPRYLKVGGNLVIDVYRYFWWQYALPGYWLRQITRRLSPERLYKLCRGYISLMWPVARLINKLPRGRYLNQLLLIADYRGVYDLPEETLKEWAVLDTFDVLSAFHIKPQSIERVREWFKKAGMANVKVHYGYNGIEGHGTRAV
jgi:SAM-dependent methyltransferase